MQKRTRANAIRRIQDVGYLNEIDSTQLLNTPKLTVENDPLDSFAFNFLGGIGLIFYLYITASRPMRIMEFGDAEMAGKELNVDWWVNEKSFYQFYGRRGPEFPRDSVLNHRLGDQGPVQPGNPVEGYLLGRCFIPLQSTLLPTCPNGFDFPVTLSILALSTKDGAETCLLSDLSVRFDKSLNIEAQPRASSLYQPQPKGLGLDHSYREKNGLGEERQSLANGPRTADPPAARPRGDKSGAATRQGREL